MALNEHRYKHVNKEIIIILNSTIIVDPQTEYTYTPSQLLNCV